MIDNGVSILVGAGNDGAVIVELIVNYGRWGENIWEVVVWHWFVLSSERVLIPVGCLWNSASKSDAWRSLALTHESCAGE